ncbi:hypothetical protein MNBD_CPR01-486 [hydrothermal vent metagenome]|uniref:Uncharacterized protein n=1 Tax=hydrothermal vent metagenome TaxID=652676 RepID=A0A3B0UZ94_9ZZZZ
MKSLKDFLKNKSIPGAELSNIRHLCAVVASEIVGIDIKPTQVDYHEETISFLIPPILKTEIILQQKKLITKLKERGIIVNSIL